MKATLGERFARALAVKDGAALRALLADRVDFRALTPGAHWDATIPEQIVDGIVLGHWFDSGDHIERLCSIRTDRVGDREHVSYRFRVRSGADRFVVEQQAYYAAEDDRITWMRVLCSGFRPEIRGGSGVG